MQRLAVDAEDQVALLEAGLLGRVSGLDAGQLDLAALVPAGVSHAQLLAQNGRHGGVEFGAVALDGDVHGAVGAGEFLEPDIFPGGIGFALQLDDLVAVLNAGFGGRGSGHHVPDHGFQIRIGDLLVLHHVQPGEHSDRQHDIHERPGEGDDQPLPARLVGQAARVVGRGRGTVSSGPVNRAEGSRRRPASSGSSSPAIFT